MISCNAIHNKIENAQSAFHLAEVLRAHADDIVTVGLQSRQDYDSLRIAALVHAERVSGKRFPALLADALSVDVDPLVSEDALVEAAQMFAKAVAAHKNIRDEHKNPPLVQMV